MQLVVGVVELAVVDQPDLHAILQAGLRDAAGAIGVDRDKRREVIIDGGDPGQVRSIRGWHLDSSDTITGSSANNVIDGGAGAAVATETLIRLAAHPRIVGVKDAKDSPGATSHVLAQTDLVFYCGTDMLNLPWLSLGAVGFVSVVGHVVGDRLHEMIDAFGAGDVARARQLHYELIPVYDGLFRNQGAVMTKAALDLLGLPGGAVRLPLLAATDAERHQLALDLTAGGVKL